MFKISVLYGSTQHIMSNKTLNLSKFYTCFALFNHAAFSTEAVWPQKKMKNTLRVFSSTSKGPYVAVAAASPW